MVGISEFVVASKPVPVLQELAAALSGLAQVLKRASGDWAAGRAVGPLLLNSIMEDVGVASAVTVSVKPLLQATSGMAEVFESLQEVYLVLRACLTMHDQEVFMQDVLLCQARVFAAAAVFRVRPQQALKFYNAGVAAVCAKLGFDARRGLLCGQVTEPEWRAVAMHADVSGLPDTTQYKRRGATLVVGAGGSTQIPDGYGQAMVLRLQDYKFLMKWVKLVDGVPVVHVDPDKPWLCVEHGVPVPLVDCKGVLEAGEGLHVARLMVLLFEAAVVVGRLMSQPGTCYLRGVPPHHRSYAAFALGEWPDDGVLAELLPSVRNWCDKRAQWRHITGRDYHVVDEGRLVGLPKGARLGGDRFTRPPRGRTLNPGVVAEASSALEHLLQTVSPRDEAARARYTHAAAQRAAPARHSRSPSYDPQSLLQLEGRELGRALVPAKPAAFPSVFPDPDYIPDLEYTGSKASDRMDSLMERLDRGTVVSDSYVRRVKMTTGVRTLSLPRGEVIAVAGPRVSQHVNPPLRWVQDSLKVSGWTVYKAALAKSVLFSVAPADGAPLCRLDFSSEGSVQCRSFTAQSKSLVVWVRSLEDMVYTGKTGIVRMFVPERGEASGLGLFVQRLQEVYAISAVRTYGVQGHMRPDLSLPLEQVEVSPAGYARFVARVGVAGAGDVSFVFGCDAEVQKRPAVLSVSGPHVVAVKVGGVTVHAERPPGSDTYQVGVMVCDWGACCAVEIQRPGEVRFVIDGIVDAYEFERSGV